MGERASTVIAMSCAGGGLTVTGGCYTAPTACSYSVSPGGVIALSIALEGEARGSNVLDYCETPTFACKGPALLRGRYTLANKPGATLVVDDQGACAAAI